MSVLTLLFCGTFLLSALFVFLVLRFARKRSLFDQIDERKVHTEQIPRLGGVGFISAYMLVILLLTVLDFWEEPANLSFGMVLAAMVLVLVFGIRDDLKPLRARYKLGIQVLAALLIVVAGYGFRSLSFPKLGYTLILGFWRYPLTIIWIVGIINALNLIDGIDGLSGGLSFIILASYSLIFSFLGYEQEFILCILLMAAVAGFLLFNAPLPRARIFMGDTGSQFLGLFIAIIPFFESSRTLRSAVPLPFAAGLTLIPISDTFAAIWRRTREKRGIYEPDREHTHHKLLALGFNALTIDLLLYAIQFWVSACIVLALTILVSYKLQLTLAAYGLVIGFFILLHYAYRHHVMDKKSPVQPRSF